MAESVLMELRRRAALAAAEARRATVAEEESGEEDEGEDESSGGFEVPIPRRPQLAPRAIEIVSPPRRELSSLERLARQSEHDPIVKRFEELRAERGRGRLGAWEKHVLLTGEFPRGPMPEADYEPPPDEDEELLDEVPAKRRKLSKRMKTFGMIGGVAFLLVAALAASSRETKA